MIQQLPSLANFWPHENLDNAQTGLHDYMMWRKYGFGRACSQLSVDIRAGRISREDALIELEDREGKFPIVYAGVSASEMLYRIGISLPYLCEVMEKFTNKVIHAGNENHTDSFVEEPCPR